MGFEDLAVVGGVLALAGFLAGTVERVIEKALKPMFEKLFVAFGLGAEKLSAFIPLVAFVLGALLSYGFGLDLFAPLAEVVGLEPAAWLTQGLTAVVVGGGSNLINDLWPQTGGVLEPVELEIDEEGNVTSIARLG